MEIKAKDMCPRCKHCLGMTPQGMYSCGYANDGSELNIGIDVVMNCANFEEVNMNKIEGKVVDFCPKCKNCKCVTNQYDGNDVIRIIEVECEDPYDGMVKTLDADSSICCSMFEARPNPTHVCYEQEVKTVKPGEKVDIPDHGRYPWGKDKEPCDKISLLQHELEMDRLMREIHQLEKEKAAHMKGIERLKKSQEKLQNQVKNLQTTNEESYKREEKLEDKCRKLERRFTEEKKRFDRLYNEFLIPLTRVLYPREGKICKLYSEVLNDIKNLMVESEENETMYNDLKYWKERCHKAETDVTTLNSNVELLEKKISELESRRTYWEKKALKNAADLNQTISDQEITIKALLLTIKEMCKECETNE